MEPRIENLSEKKLVGKRLRMTLADNKTFELWRSFMPERKLISNTISTDLFSLQVYSEPMDCLNPQAEFEKWALIEVADFHDIPQNMERYILNGGLYAVFMHYGPPQNFPSTFSFIFNKWLPQSGYVVDHREHFELLGEKYKNNAPDSEEEIWIPIRKA